MSGHSKWATIHRKKGLIDAARGKVFQKLAKEIYVAARGTNGDIDMNPSLRAVVEKAKKLMREWDKSHCGIAVLSFTNVAIDEIKKAIAENENIRYKYSTRFLSIKLLENDRDIERTVRKLPNGEEIIDDENVVFGRKIFLAYKNVVSAFFCKGSYF